MPEDSDKPQVLRAAVRLGKPSRWAAFLLGLAGMGAGGLAAFKAHLEAPPVALLAVGLILALVGLAGIVPTRIKAGDYEAEFYQEQGRQVANVLKQGVEAAETPDAKEEVAEIVDRVAEVAPEIAAPAQSAYRFEQSVRSLIFEMAVIDWPGAVATVETPGRSRFDGLIVLPAGLDVLRDRERHILIEIKQQSSNKVVDQLMAGAQIYAASHPDVDTVVLLISRFPGGGFRAGDWPVGLTAVIAPGMDRRHLQAGLESAKTSDPIPVERS